MTNTATASFVLKEPAWDGWSTIGGPAFQVVAYADRLAALTPDRSAVYSYDFGSRSWVPIGGPAKGLIGGGWDLYAVSGDLWRFDGAGWGHVSGPAAQFVAIGNAVYRLVADRSRVERYDRYADTWTPIGGPAESLIGGGSRLYAVEPGGGAIHEYSRVHDAWTEIGGPGAQFVGVRHTVYGLNPDRSAVFRYDGTPHVWTQVGGPASRLIGGGGSVYAAQPGTGAIFRNTGFGDEWDEVVPAGGGTGFVAVSRRLYGMPTGRSEVRELDPTDAESRRLRTLLYRANDDNRFGGRIRRGFLVQRLDGPVLSEHNAEVTHQPVSCLKLLPYAHALIDVDRGVSSMDSEVQWTEKVKNDDPGDFCLTPGSAGTRTGRAAYRDALPTMMWFSHNRTLEALLTRLDPASLTDQAQARGLRQTEMYFGCSGTRGPLAWWAHNMTTLEDMFQIFRGFERLTWISKQSTLDLFRRNMAQHTPAPGTGYTSPYLGSRHDPNTNEFLRALITREAPPGKQGIVNEFMTHVTMHQKVGGGFPTPDEHSYGEANLLSLPLKVNGKIRPTKFFVGWYFSQARISIEGANTDPDLEVFKAELYIRPIRQALATW